MTTHIFGYPVESNHLLRYLQFGLHENWVRAYAGYQLALASARKAGISVADSELQEHADLFRRSQRLYSRTDTLAWLHKTGLTPALFEELVEERVMISKFKDKIVSERLSPFWEKHRPLYDQAEISQIVSTDGDLAHTLKQQIDRNESSFFDLARTYSQDAASRMAGGYVGLIPRSRLNPAVQDVILGATEGTTVGPLEVNSQFVLVEVHQIIPARWERVSPVVAEDVWDLWLKENQPASSVAANLKS